MKQPRRIILCLDGTGNQFQGNESDTNVVKIYRCWIAGIGTYVNAPASRVTYYNPWPKITPQVVKTVDQGVEFDYSTSAIASPSAWYIRHAVSIHERRLKFKPVLLIPDPDGPPVNLKEVWFAGNHSDIRGFILLTQARSISCPMHR
ncbi:hypothetical protein AWENTII_005731 [Aspergillus wentii]|nr:hypothetical protein MW887_000361 [Aspergillus wentii]